MTFSFSVQSAHTEELRKEYKKVLSDMDLKDLVKELISYLDYVEESDSGREFNPITIGSCRVLMTEPLNMCLKEIRKHINEMPDRVK